MRLLFWIVLRFRFKQNFWGKLWLWYHKRQTDKFLNSLNLDTPDIKIIN